jgi:hypothetical protein
MVVFPLMTRMARRLARMYFPADGSFPADGADWPADWRGCTFPQMVVFPLMARIGPQIGPRMYFPADGSFPADDADWPADWRGCTFPLMVIFPLMARIGPQIGADVLSR